MYQVITKIIDLIYENSCAICGSSSKTSMVCKSCEASFIKREHDFKRFKEINVYSWGFYDGKLRDGIIKLKSGKKKLATYFSKILADFWTATHEDKSKDCLVIPIPSHKKRIKERGYCQSSLIAKSFAEHTGKGFSNNLIIRTKETKYMNSLNNLNERIENIQNAFNITKPIIQEIKNILIIDDILTSGSTICEVAKIIKRAYLEINLTGLTVASGDTYN